MQVLSEVPKELIRIGDRVKSMRTLREGVITGIIPIEQARRFEDMELLIRWENGNISQQWLYMYDGVWMM